ncbi:MAG: SdiA-regulated domain-containing protein [Kofleriaceae bacterium]
MRSSWLVAIAFAAGCAAEPSAGKIDPFVDSGKADGAGLSLALVSDHGMDLDEPSDLAFAAGQLYAVSDAHSKIYAISRKGNIKREIDVQGDDLEALAVDPTTGEFLLADESRAKIWRLDPSGARQQVIELDGADDGNSGIEGITVDDNGHIFVVKEKDPARIYELDASGTELRRTKIEFAADLSAIAWNPLDGRIYVLSDIDQAMFRLDADWNVETGWRLPIETPEGLAFDGSTVFIASDQKAKLYRLELTGE